MSEAYEPLNNTISDDEWVVVTMYRTLRRRGGKAQFPVPTKRVMTPEPMVVMEVLP